MTSWSYSAVFSHRRGDTPCHCRPVAAAPSTEKRSALCRCRHKVHKVRNVLGSSSEGAARAGPFDASGGVEAGLRRGHPEAGAVRLVAGAGVAVGGGKPARRAVGVVHGQSPWAAEVAAPLPDDGVTVAASTTPSTVARRTSASSTHRSAVFSSVTSAWTCPIGSVLILHTELAGDVDLGVGDGDGDERPLATEAEQPPRPPRAAA